MAIINPNQIAVTNLVKSSPVKTEASAEQKADMFNRESKLLKHLDRISEWREKGTTIPISVVLDPTFKCNHRCPGCHGLMGQDLSTIPYPVLDKVISELGRLGVRSLPLGGGGDPSCHHELAKILRSINRAGMDTSFYTNGELLKTDTIAATVETCSWVRFSLDADGPEMHQLVHKASPKAFDKVVRNIDRMVRARTRAGTDMTLGAGFLVKPETIKGMFGATKLCKELGLDYIRIRPFFGYDNKPICNETEATEVLDELKRCEELASDDFDVNFPPHRMQWVAQGDAEIKYRRCNVHHFATYIGGDAKVYLCCHTVGWDKYCLGDLNKNTFEEIWFSEERRKIYENIDYRDCATPCSMAVFNDALHKFDIPTIHTNFL
jgi:GTP 3',8-cyclase